MAADQTPAVKPEETAPPEVVNARPRQWQRVVAWQDEVTRREEGEEDTAWLVTYLDMMTLLLTVFVVMLAYSTFQPDKFTRPQEAASEDVSKETKGAAKAAIESRHDPASLLAQKLAQQLVDAGLTDAVKMEVEDRRLTLQMQEKILFASGHAELNDQGRAVLNRLAPTFMAPGQMISVEGHTDNIPISTGLFPSNWELSATRATRVVRHLAERGVPAGRLRAIGYGDTHSIASNAEEQGRTSNRRVSIVIDLAIVGTPAAQEAVGEPRKPE